MDALFAAVVEASEEAVLNSMFASPTVVGRSGNTSPGIPVDEVVDLLRRHGRVAQ
jgi:D-aminopeptidase